MAIQRREQQTNQQPEQRQEQQASQQQRPQYEQQSQSTGTGSYANMRGGLKRRLPKTAGSSVVSNFINLAEMALGDFSKDNNIMFQRLDNDRFNMHFSVVSFIEVSEQEDGNVAMVYSYILEGSNRQPDIEHRNFHNQQIDVVVTAMDAYDEQVWSYIQGEFQNQYGDKVQLVDAGATIVPRELELTEENIDKIFDVISNGYDAIQAMKEVKYPDQYVHVNINDFINRGKQRVTAQFDYTHVDDDNVVGLPVRTDIAMKIGTQDLNNRNGQFSFQHQSSSKLMSASAFIDLVYTPDNTPVGPHQQRRTQVYTPRMVITKINALEGGALTPETFFLTLATMNLVSDNYAWASVFNDFNSDLHNIGAIGLRMPNPQDPTSPIGRIDTSKNSFGQKDLYDLIQTTINPIPAISIDCEDFGPDSWLTNMLIGAAHGSPHAHKAIVDACDRLTGGAFTKYFGGNDPIVANVEQNRVFLGTFKDEKGVVRDIREIDSLAMLNVLGDKDINAVNMYDMTNLPGNDIQYRLSERYRILRNVLNNNMTIRGYAERLTFSDKFIDALVMATGEAGLSVEQSGLESIVGQQQFQGNQFIGNYVGHGGAMGTLAYQGQNNYSGGFQRRSTSTWG